jgi:bifunctional non-homologous end joining protein LigD
MPVFDYAPQLAMLTARPPSGDDWLHEIKLDGYRVGCQIAGGQVRLESRNGLDWTTTFPEIVDAARALHVEEAVLDGELVVLLPDGRTSFEAMQQAVAGPRGRAGLVYFVFDLLSLDHEPIGRLPLDERKARLKHLLGQNTTGRIRYMDHVIGQGAQVLEHACRLGLEGIVSKRRDLPYQPGRRDSWRKTKCLRRGLFVIGGFTDPEGSRAGLGAVHVGRYTGSRLVFCGRVGTGFTQAFATDLRTRLEAALQRECPFDPVPPRSLAGKAHWVAPQLVCEVTFIEYTNAGVLRHPSFQRLRPDVAPRDVIGDGTP